MEGGRGRGNRVSKKGTSYDSHHFMAAMEEGGREILFDLSNTPIIYFARCCDEDEDEEIPKETGEMGKGKGNWRRRKEAGKNMARKMSAGRTAAGRLVRRGLLHRGEDVMNRASTAVVNLRESFFLMQGRRPHHCNATLCISRGYLASFG